LEDCPECGRAVLDHSFVDAIKCAYVRAEQARALLRAALTTAEETVDGGTWTRAADTRNALESMDQVLQFAAEAYPPLKRDED